MSGENTPNPVELDPERLLAELDRRASLPELVPERAFTIGIRWILRQAAALIRTRTAERDALAAVIEKAANLADEHVSSVWEGGADPDEATTTVTLYRPVFDTLTEAPHVVLAARDARVLREHAFEIGRDSHSPAAERVALDIADRIERESQG